MAYDFLLSFCEPFAVEPADIGVIGVLVGSGDAGLPAGGIGGMAGIGYCPTSVLMGLRLAMLILRPWLVCVVTVGRCAGCA